MNIFDSGKNLRSYPLVAGLLITGLFSVILSINEIFEVYSLCTNAGLVREFSYLIDFSVRFLSGAVAVIIFIPSVLYLTIRHLPLKEYLTSELKLRMSISPRSVIAGLVSALCYFVICIIVAFRLGTLQIDFNLLIDLETGLGWILFLYALVPAIWEELAFRGAIMNIVRAKYSDNAAILVSSVFFGLFHIIAFAVVGNTAMVFPGFIMSTLFGLTWGYMNLKCNSLLPSILAHYAIDAFGYAFIYHSLNAAEALVGAFFITTTILYPVITIILANLLFKRKALIHHQGS